MDRAQLIRPDAYVPRIFDLDPEAFNGMNLVVLDLDNTLVIPETCETPPEIRAWVEQLRSHSHCVIVSNSRTRKARKARIEELFGCTLLVDAPRKPFRALEHHLIALIGSTSPRIAVIGDRLLVDVCFGRRIGAFTVLVKPLSKNERWNIRLMRIFEEALLYLFFR